MRLIFSFLQKTKREKKKKKKRERDRWSYLKEPFIDQRRYYIK